MANEIFKGLREIEEEANALVEAAQQRAEEIRESAEGVSLKIQEVVGQKIEGLRHTMAQELETEKIRMETEAQKRLAEGKQALDQVAEQSFPQAVAKVVKECLEHGHR